MISISIAFPQHSIMTIRNLEAKADDPSTEPERLGNIFRIEFAISLAVYTNLSLLLVLFSHWRKSLPLQPLPQSLCQLDIVAATKSGNTDSLVSF